MNPARLLPGHAVVMAAVPLNDSTRILLPSHQQQPHTATKNDGKKKQVV